MSISDNVSMFYNAKPHIFEKAKILRDNMTFSEKQLWEHLRGKKNAQSPIPSTASH